MSVYAIADLHLSMGAETNKSMEVFGKRWRGYIEKLQDNWLSIVKEGDSVIIPGDISWAMTLPEAKDDFLFLDSLPGKKYIGKGNHDFWWTSITKMQKFFKDNNILSIEILYNNAYRFDNCIICGTRGWFIDEKQQNTVGDVDFNKMINREAIRLRLSLENAKTLSQGSSLPIKAFLHFPPVWNGFVCQNILDLLREFSVDTCYFGHIHGNYSVQQMQFYEGIGFIFCAADYLNFTPLLVK
jgi:predicted phosphohydrolase